MVQIEYERSGYDIAICSRVCDFVVSGLCTRQVCSLPSLPFRVAPELTTSFVKIHLNPRSQRKDLAKDAASRDELRLSVYRPGFLL